jgi:hypothetical protein
MPTGPAAAAKPPSVSAVWFCLPYTDPGVNAANSASPSLIVLLPPFGAILGAVVGGVVGAYTSDVMESAPVTLGTMLDTDFGERPLHALRYIEGIAGE